MKENENRDRKRETERDHQTCFQMTSTLFSKKKKFTQLMGKQKDCVLTGMLNCKQQKFLLQLREWLK